MYLFKLISKSFCMKKFFYLLAGVMICFILFIFYLMVVNWDEIDQESMGYPDELNQEVK